MLSKVPKGRYLDLKRAPFASQLGGYLQAIWWSLQNQHVKNMDKIASLEVWNEKFFFYV